MRAEAVEDDVVRERYVREDEAGLLLVRVVPLRIQHAEIRLPVCVGIDVRRELHARRTRTIEDADELVRLPPQIVHPELDVRHLDGHAVRTSDGDYLVDGVPEPAVLATNVADVPAAGVGRNLRERDDFVTRRVDAGVVLE